MGQRCHGGHKRVGRCREAGLGGHSGRSQGGLTVPVIRSDWFSTERCSASPSVCWQQTLDFVSQVGITQFPQLPLIKTQILHRHKELAGRLTVHCWGCKCQSNERAAMERAWERHLRCMLLPCCLSLGACSFWSNWICLCYLILSLTCLPSSLL
ncbi:unnamed protein product [Tetraodon nigroviridis]|uniref:(spotted green pufferfish) hypothetical protein n=1 Tax=Tetraodon nigroviridis TaxID=99883 RepID=Q4SGN5_TETNG|nr:unnamed protein product [Tetraodon nigroviridis]